MARNIYEPVNANGQVIRVQTTPTQQMQGAVVQRPAGFTAPAPRPVVLNNGYNYSLPGSYEGYTQAGIPPIMGQVSPYARIGLTRQMNGAVTPLIGFPSVYPHVVDGNYYDYSQPLVLSALAAAMANWSPIPVMGAGGRGATLAGAVNHGGGTGGGAPRTEGTPAPVAMPSQPAPAYGGAGLRLGPRQQTLPGVAYRTTPAEERMPRWGANQTDYWGGITGNGNYAVNNQTLSDTVFPPQNGWLRPDVLQAHERYSAAMVLSDYPALPPQNGGIRPDLLQAHERYSAAKGLSDYPAQQSVPVQRTAVAQDEPVRVAPQLPNPFQNPSVPQYNLTMPQVSQSVPAGADYAPQRLPSLYDPARISPFMDASDRGFAGMNPFSR